MGEAIFCSYCGELESDCVCDVVIEYLEDNDPDFKFEWAHESTTESNSTSFRIILPIYE